jgi:predicted esterase
VTGVSHRWLGLISLALVASACGYAPPFPTPPPPTPTPLPVPNATCGGCPAQPCTRDCLPALTQDGPVRRPYSRGTCPPLSQGANLDVGFTGRTVLLYIPTSTRGPFGVVFAWSAGGSAEAYDFLATRYDQDGYILVIPNGRPQYPLTWDMDRGGAEADLRFFDDVVTCLAEQYPIDLRRVHSTGYSVGGIFTAYLMGYRSETLASIVAWSTGETDPSGRRMVPSPRHRIPGLLYHGGSHDEPDYAGREGTLALASRMASNGQFTVVCDHGLGHTIPGPLDATLQQMWTFMLAHPFTPGNAAAWAESGIAGKLPDFCRVVG